MSASLDSKMDFLFTPLPPCNFNMNDDELKLWQRNAIFECECDNFINLRVESLQPNQPVLHCSNRPILIHSAIEAAINSCGLHSADEEDSEPPPTQRRRLNEAYVEQEPVVDNTLEDFYEEAIAMAIRDRGLRKNP